nr:hypothetical protein [Muricomes intestini]
MIKKIIEPNIRIRNAGRNHAGSDIAFEEIIVIDTKTITINSFCVFSISFKTQYMHFLFSSVTLTPVFQNSGNCSTAVIPKYSSHPIMGLLKAPPYFLACQQHRPHYNALEFYSGNCPSSKTGKAISLSLRLNIPFL